MQSLFSPQQQSHELEHCLKGLIDWIGFAWQELWKLLIVSLTSWIPRVYMPAWSNFEALSWLSEANVAKKLPIVPISTVFYFFSSIAKISEIFRNVSSLNAYVSDLKGVSVQFSHRPERKTRTEFLLNKSSDFFDRQDFICLNILKLSNLLTALKKFDEILLVNLWFNGLLPHIYSHLWLMLKMLYFLVCSMFFAAEKLTKNLRKIVCQFLYPLFGTQADWNVCLRSKIDETSRIVLIDILPKNFRFFLLSFAANFLVSPQHNDFSRVCYFQMPISPSLCVVSVHCLHKLKLKTTKKQFTGKKTFGNEDFLGEIFWILIFLPN